MLFRKKPVVIEAIQYLAYSENIKECVDFTNGLGGLNLHYEFLINTLEGVMVCNRGDWIIKGIKGEFYPCKPDIFEQTYEKADNV